MDHLRPVAVAIDAQSVKALQFVGDHQAPVGAGRAKQSADIVALLEGRVVQMERRLLRNLDGACDEKPGLGGGKTRRRLAERRLFPGHATLLAGNHDVIMQKTWDLYYGEGRNASRLLFVEL